MGYAAYPAYEDRGRFGRGAQPVGWESRRLKFAVALRNDKVESESCDLEYIGLEHIESWTGKRIPDDSAASEGVASRFDEGDVLFGKLRPYLAKVYLAAGPGIATTEALVLTSSDDLWPAFLKYSLLADWFIENVSGMAYGAKMPRANWDGIGGLPILLPTTAEQRKIADFLDWKTGQIDALIEKKKALIERLQEKRLALITRAVTKGLNPDAPMRDSGIPWLGQVPAHWEVRRLKFDVTKVGSGITPRGGAEVYTAEGVPLLRSQNIQFDGLRLEDIVYIPEDVHASMSNSQVLPGDVLLNITGASIGRCHYFDGSLGEANVNQHVCIIRPQRGLETRFLHYVLWSAVGQVQIQLDQSGSGREGLNFEAIKNFVLGLPDIEEQRFIAVSLDSSLRHAASLIEKNLRLMTALAEYRTALITAATTGKIDVRNVEIGGVA